MRTTWDLAGVWRLHGWRQNDWEYVRGWAGEVVSGTRPDVQPIQATVPGSVRGALVAAGVVPDAHHGRASRESEWIEHRHWSFDRGIPAEVVARLEADPAARAVLVAESLDFAGSVLVDDAVVGTFRGSVVPVEVDVTDALRSGGRSLTIVFTGVPADLGQIGHTSRIRDWKARFGHGWDWIPRIVQIGIAAPIAIDVRSGMSLDAPLITTEYDLDSGEGTIIARASVPDGTPLMLSVTGPGVDRTVELVGPGPHRVPIGSVERWELLPDGQQAFYHATLAIDEPGGDSIARRLGFRSIQWSANEGAPEGATPWICVVNGRPTFLGGVNWVPIRADYADITEVDYRVRLEAYRDLDVRILRVWGGAALEQDIFYDLCDELGMMVWQEMPMSSSGLDNTPPSDPQFVSEVREIAVSYALRRSHHPSLIMWDLGNELTDESTDIFTVLPLPEDHPAAKAAAEVFADLDPDRRWVTTSPSGGHLWVIPMLSERYGTGVHHDVHGPWDQWSDTFEQWQQFWDADDALFRSEVGVGGLSPLDVLEEFGLAGPTGTERQRAELEHRWDHATAKRAASVFGISDAPLGNQVDALQEHQSTYYAYAAQSVVDRFPAAGGFIIWMGHDAFPVAVSHAVLDFHGRAKPSAGALGAVFRKSPR